MDFQSFVDGFYSTTCVISVEKNNDGGCGDLRIVAGNQKFVAMAEHPPYITDPDIPLPKFEPGHLYDVYLPKTPDFEDKCFRAATQKKTIHTYIYLNVCNLWFNMSFVPVEYEDGNKCYCTYSTEPVEVDDIDTNSSSSMTIANNVLKTCIKLRSTNDFKATMNDVIKDIRVLCGAEVCTVLTVDQDNATSSILAASKADDSTIKTLSKYTNMYDVAMSWLDTIGERDSIIVKSEKDLEYVKTVNYAWYKTLADSNVKSIVVFPLRHNKELLGFIWATNFDVDEVARIKETLELTTFFISSEIASYKMLRQLERISYTDLLTGIMNRNSMNNRVTGIVDGEPVTKPYAVIFADLNGLKRVNDENGHSAGDLLLKKAGLVLQEVFVDDEVYRAGGDEFMVIVSGSRDEFDKKISLLRAKASDPDYVCLSFGYCFNDSDMDIRDAMRIADEEMYKDKEKYYSEHPDRRYR
ncbi:MAG: sensor domain-containing diguanylate cyclase [Clostridiales bacterium]|nr:sensor domain-containing diguanylate cyclase [Clostridiales bacterium]